MDPNAVWKELSDAFQEEDKERSAELAAALIGWLKKNGYPPTITHHQKFDRFVVLSTCDAIVNAV